MQIEDKPAFEGMLAELFGAIDKPLTEAKREGFWKGLAKMGILEFSRCRDQLLAELEDGETRKTFSVSDVWAARKRTRARQHTEPVTPTEDTWHGDAWEARANQLLRRHISTRLHADPCCYGRPATARGMRVDRSPNADSSDDFVSNVRHLVEAKREWAADMRDMDPACAGVDGKIQRECWLDYIQLAERRIAAQMQEAA